MRCRSTLQVLVASAALVCWFSACAELEDDTVTPDAATDILSDDGVTADTGPTADEGTPDVADPCGEQTGEELYSALCAVCHGADLQGWTGDAALLGPGLAGEGLREWWFKLTREGTVGRYGDVGMLAYPESDWTDDELNEMLAFILNGDNAGKIAYVTACGSCHGTKPEKGGSGPALAGEGLVAQWTEQIPLRLSPEGEPPMPPYPKMCADDAQAIAQYLVDAIGTE